MKTEKIDFVGIETKEIRLCETEQEEKEGYLEVHTTSEECGTILLRVNAEFSHPTPSHLFVTSHRGEFLRVATLNDLKLSPLNPAHNVEDVVSSYVGVYFATLTGANEFLLGLIEEVKLLKKEIGRVHKKQPMINGKVLI